ncbi:Cell division control protein 11 [Mycoemilia scoparia]|uniref:Cell division control protein 11 n=1 Tax=Mycoemilia scoparia TaxID=417184 RepID=A0A9W7ZQB2_9FUNG|nr:Cell division control protein 11 [Mycoemilia scoparia]
MATRLMTPTNSPRPTSLRYKTEKRGIRFNIMLVGASGLGRRTFLNTLCEREVVPQPDIPDPEQAHVVEPMRFNKNEVQIIEDGTNIFLTVIDTPGFGDAVDNESCFEQLKKYIEAQFDEVLVEESRIKRNAKHKDNRVHALLYFITPTGHSLREIDIELIKRLGRIVNIIPVIGRADSLTIDELVRFKASIMKDIQHYELPIYNFCWDDEADADAIEENQEIQAIVPFSVVGCDEVIDEDHGSVRVRNYPWGTVEVDNDEQSDFGLLRYIMLNSHVADLIDYTQSVLYEKYRTDKLNRSGFDEYQEGQEEA